MDAEAFGGRASGHLVTAEGGHSRAIEDTEGTDVIAPEWDWRRDLG